MKNHLVKTSMVALVGVLGLGLAGVVPAMAQQDPVAERAIAGAKAYVKAHNLQNPKIDMLLNSLYRTVSSEPVSAEF